MRNSALSAAPKASKASTKTKKKELLKKDKDKKDDKKEVEGKKKDDKKKDEKKEDKKKEDDKKEVEGKKADEDAPPVNIGWDSHKAVVSQTSEKLKKNSPYRNV
jgi:hypothetical protein